MTKINQILALLLFSTWFASCSKPQAENTLIYCSEGSPSAFNPQITSDGTSANAVAEPIYNRLTAFEYGTTNVIPSLAKEWTISDDGLEYVFTLNQNVNFHNTPYFTPTRPLNADDVLFSFNRMRLKDHPYHLVSGGTYEYFRAMDMGELIKDIQKIDDHQVKFILSKPNAPFVANLAMGFASILSKEYADQLVTQDKKELIDQMPIGTGPFIFQSYAKDTLIRYSSHPNYFEGKAKLDRLIFSITPDPTVRFQKLKANECQFISLPSPNDFPAMEADPNIELVSQEGFNVGYIGFNVTKPPFNKKAVREAINYAINREAIIEAIYLGNARPAKNPIPPTIWSYKDDLPHFEYNPEKAKSILKGANITNLPPIELWTLPVSRPYNPNGKKLGEMIQADLEKIGLQVRLTTYDWPTYLAKSRKGDHQSVMFGWTGDNGDPDNFFFNLLSCAGVEGGSNVARWCHPEFDQLVTQAQREKDLSKRKELYEKAQEIFREELPWAPIAHSVDYRAHRSSLKGYKIDPLGHDIFHTVYFAD